MKQADVLIVGSGIAALQLANKLRTDLNVIILTKMEMKAGNSYMAQGGVAAALGSKDDPYLHYLDTMEAGNHHNNAEAVLTMTKEAPRLIKDLWDAGCDFDKDPDGQLQLGMEGAHRVKRIVHGGGDATGKHMIDFQISRLNRHIKVEESVFVYELMMNATRDTCIGVKGMKPDGTKEFYFADHVVLATGGCGQLYSFTSNAETATGDGVALAYLAGAELADMEFIQFHPTLLYVDGRTKGLISEAVRGEGAVLVLENGKRIMENIHPLKDLAPRHIVSQTIYEYLKIGEQVYLDISGIAHFTERFPTVSELCKNQGIDLERGLIPVAPGSHFLMGGIKTDLDGKTGISGLFAIGEVACTGIHGANRLASNSLLEGMFIGSRLAEWINQNERRNGGSFEMADLPSSKKIELINIPDIMTLQKDMMDRAGIVRKREALFCQKMWFEGQGISEMLEGNFDEMSAKDINRIFMCITAWLITTSALERTESRGGHFREDFPYEDNRNWMKRQIIQKKIESKEQKYEYNQAALVT